MTIYKKNSKYLLVSLLFLSPILIQVKPGSIENIENNIIGNNKKDEIDQTCSICMDNIDSAGLSLNCNHRFHENCLRSWLEVNNTCPICRKEISLPELNAELNNSNQNSKEELFEQIRNYFKQFGSEDVDYLIDTCYNEPYLLLGDECQAFLTDDMKEVVNQFLQAEYPENRTIEQAYHKPLSQTGLFMLKELSDSFEEANNPDVDSILIDASTNPLVLAEHSWFTRLLSQRQRDLVSSIIDDYTGEETL